MKRRRMKHYLAVSVALLTCLVYLPALRNDFVLTWDDSQYISKIF